MERKGFIGGYHLINDSKDDTSKYRPVPSKNFYSHIHDALQYGILRCNEIINETNSQDLTGLGNTIY